MKNRMFVLGTIAIGVIAFAIFMLMPKPTAPPAASQPMANITAGSFVRPHSPTLGNTMARVTVVEWFDPECEACRMVHPVVKKIVADYGDRVRFVFRYMPFHANSMLASSAIEEAREMGKFEEALDLLFDKQPEWGDHQKPKPELIPTYIASLGVPKSRLNPEELIAKHSEKIKMDESDGRGVGVRGTPSFFVNGQMVMELGDEPLRAAIDAALKP